MELWIRSQDKRHLIKADYVSIMENNIINAASSGWDYDVAKYKSKERALEVLDEIQELLQPIYKISSEFKKSEITGNCQWIENQEYIPIQNKIYEMPKE